MATELLFSPGIPVARALYEADRRLHLIEDFLHRRHERVGLSAKAASALG
jgi:hypothetical protein